jgi:hypothetical protein
MIPILVYAGSNIITGSTGIDYDNPPRFSFFGNEDTYFNEVRIMIYKQLGLLENQYLFSIRARYNTWGTGAYHFSLIPIRYEVEWRTIFQMATIEMNWRMVELYLEISSISNAEDSLNNLPESSNRTENIIPSTINLAHQIHESDPQRFVYPTLKKAWCRNVHVWNKPNCYIMLSYFGGNKSQKIRVKSVYMSFL